MIGVAAFVKRNPRLSRTEYQAAHVGHHGSLGRRMQNMRGYVFSLWIDRDFDRVVPGASRGAPPGFFDLWDACSELYFEDLEDMTNMVSAYDRAGPDGVRQEDLTNALYEDGGWLVAQGAFHFPMDDRVIQPVIRPERRVTKLMQWGKRRPEMPFTEFAERWSNDYAPLYTEIAGMSGQVLTFRADDSQLRDFYEESSPLDTSASAIDRFYALWDGYSYLYMDSLQRLATFRENASPEFLKLERELFGEVWYREVEESVIVLPRRDDTTDPNISIGREAIVSE